MLQLAVAVIGITSAMFSGSVATSQALPHFSTTGPLTTSLAGPPPYFVLKRTGQPDNMVYCTTLALTAGPVGPTTEVRRATS